MRRIVLIALSGLVSGLVLTGVVSAEDKDSGSSEGDSQRQTFNSEVCKVDGLKASQCDCAWEFIAKKLSPADLKLAMLLTASSSANSDVAKKADEQLDKSNATDKKRDSVSSEISALIIEAEDACAKK